MPGRVPLGPVTPVCAAGLRALLVVLLVSGLLAPRMSAVLAQVIPGIQTMVICTGDELMTITIGTDGVPIETQEQTQHPCVVTEGVTLAAMDLPFWQQLAADHTHRFAVRENTRVSVDHLTRLTPKRGPPVLV
jgi:hypothetical protein